MFSDESHREFQKGIDHEAGKTRRHEDRLSLRRQIRQGHLNKRRKTLQEEGGSNDNSDDSKSSQYSNKPSVVTVSSANGPSSVKLKDLGKFEQQTQSNDLQTVFQGVQSIRQLLSNQNDLPIEQIIETSVIPALVKILGRKLEIKNPEGLTPEEKLKRDLQLEASWLLKQTYSKLCVYRFCFVFFKKRALLNMVSGESKYTKTVVEMGAIEAFVELLKNTRDAELSDQA
ncbi:hypothetical protein RFI_17179, partial [Reticulomyxa filosa]